MELIFNQDGWLYRGLNRLWDLIVLNILFFLTSIPIVTVGASLSALYTVTLKGVRKEDSYIVRSYFAAFRENFKKRYAHVAVAACGMACLGDGCFCTGQESQSFSVPGRDFRNHMAFDHVVCVCASGLV